MDEGLYKLEASPPRYPKLRGGFLALLFFRRREGRQPTSVRLAGATRQGAQHIGVLLLEVYICLRQAVLGICRERGFPLVLISSGKSV